MRLIKIFFLLLPLFVLSCRDCDDHDNDDDEPIQLEYKDLTLRVFTSHPSLAYTAALFENFTEQVLLIDAHQIGASFETVTEQVIVKDAYDRYEISEQMDIPIVSNDENNKISQIPCITFYADTEVLNVVLPAVYETRSYQKVITPGTGIQIGAVYGFRTFERLISPAQLGTPTQDRAFKDYNFRILKDADIHEYLAGQLSLQGITDCLLASDYEILP